MEEMISNITKGFRGNYQYEYHFGYPVVVNDSNLVDKLYETTKKIIDENRIKFLTKPTMVGEDFSYYTQNKPGFYIFLSTKKEEHPYPHHNSKFDIDENVLPIGTLALSNFVFDNLK